MPDKTDRETVKIRADLLKSLKRLYDSANREIQAEIEELLIAIYLDDEEATQRQRIQHGEQNGLNEIIEIFVAVMLLTNERAIKRINRAANNVASINYEHIREKVKRVTGIDIRGTADPFDPTRYTRRAYNRNTRLKFVSDTVMKQIKEGLRKGESSKEISKRIQKACNVSRNSANNTAVTETTRARGMSRLDAMFEAEKHGIKMLKIWRHSIHIKHPRDWHLAQDGEQRELNEPFSNGLQYPGEEGAPPEEVCFCKCWLDEIVISP